MALFRLDELEEAARVVHARIAPTPQYVWPQINEKAGATVWVKHENHTPTGAFKVRGGITFIDWLKRAHPGTKGIITAVERRVRPGNRFRASIQPTATAGTSPKRVASAGPFAWARAS